jgi:hypothetical protein
VPTAGHQHVGDRADAAESSPTASAAESAGPVLAHAAESSVARLNPR